jgi:hypothetical protein
MTTSSPGNRNTLVAAGKILRIEARFADDKVKLLNIFMSAAQFAFEKLIIPKKWPGRVRNVGLII